MPPSRSNPGANPDPEGYYALLDLTPAATKAAIVKAYRAKARVLHPDVPRTGNAAAFLAMKQAYDVLSNAQRRSQYDQAARSAAERDSPPFRPAPFEPAPFGSAPFGPAPFTENRFTASPAAEPAFDTPASGLPRLSDMPVAVWIGLGVFLAVCIVEVVVHLANPDAQAPAGTVSIPATAASVEPLTPAQDAELRYGPAPLHLPGTANFYVNPAGGPAILYRLQPDHKTLVAEARLPPFSSVQATKLYTQSGVIEVLTGDGTTGFIPVGHLSPGGLAAARTAYCCYNAGTLPQDGEVLERSGNGPETLQVENRSIEPAVIRLRDAAGAAVVSVFLSPGGHAEVPGIPAGEFRPEYAIGELWSRACNGFATGMRAWQLTQTVRLPGQAPVVVTNDTDPSMGTAIPQDVFELK
jgi:DnaJ domain